MRRAPLLLSERSLCDLECITTGVYAPLEGFAGREDHDAVVSSMRLASGALWPIPVTLAVSREVATTIPLDEELPLAGPGGRVLAMMTVVSKYEPDRAATARAVYGTDDPAHPGVRALLDAGEVCLGGPVRAVAEAPHGEFAEYRLTPARTRAIFAERGWRTVAGFQTRNPIHRAHEYLTKVALESVDGLFVNPLVGSTKADDVPAAARMRAYEALLSRYYPAERVLLGVYPAAMRYGGPREAVLHAISRRNYGCTHFLVGRDHAGAGNYYGPYDAQRIFDRIDEAELGIRILRFDNAFWCRACGAMATAKSCPHPASQHLSLSGTKVREMLANGERPPVQFTRPEVADVLMQAFADPAAATDAAAPATVTGGAAGAPHAFRLADAPTPTAAPTARGFTVWFTGLSGAGKTTLATLLEAELRGRAVPVEVLDGDVVRTNLSKGLGFSKEDRDTNIRRIGFVAELLARNGVAVIVAAISPYREVRDEVRARIGRFVEVHVDATVEVCAARDTKGLYAKALAGEIRGFTGVDDPYEAPVAPEVRCPTGDEAPEVSVARIVAALEGAGFLASGASRAGARG